VSLVSAGKELRLWFFSVHT